MSQYTDLVLLYGHISMRRKWQLVGLLILMVLGALAEMATLAAVVPFLSLLASPNVSSKQPLAGIFDLIISGSENLLWNSAILFAAIALGAAAIRTLLMWASLRIGFGLGADIGGDVYLRMLHRPYSWHVNHNSSEVLGSLEKVNSVVHNIITPILQGCVALILSLGLLGMLLTIDMLTALYAGAFFAALYVITSILLRQKLTYNDKIISENLNLRIQAVQEGIGGIREVLLDGTQSIYHRRFIDVDYTVRRSQAANNLISASPRYVIESVGMVFMVMFAGWMAGGQSGLAGALPILGALALGAQKLLPQMQIAYQSWSNLRGARNQLKDVLAILDQTLPEDYGRHSRVDRHQNPNCDPDFAAPLISLRGVSFSYQPGTDQVLLDINLQIQPGDRIGFIGQTGSGKSTLIDLILGLLVPSSGSIEINGQALYQNTIRSWQNRIAHVPQHIFLSDASIAENIAFGVPASEIDIERVKFAASQAQIKSFINSLPHAYNTSVGERGVRLSGGQRQRIGLARALYKKADILVLDEATSALDDVTEASVMASIQYLNPSLTVLMIAHRLSTLQDCNQIIELDAGRIARILSYTDLINSNLKKTQKVLISHA